MTTPTAADFLAILDSCLPIAEMPRLTRESLISSAGCAVREHFREKGETWCERQINEADANALDAGVHPARRACSAAYSYAARTVLIRNELY